VPPPERERDVRMLAMLVRTMRDLVGFDAGVAAPEPDDDPVPDNIDEFRFELARRIQAFVDERRAAKEAAKEAGKEAAKEAAKGR
jgi:hypothetical protein